MTVGRRSALPSAFANCPFVTGFGAVRFTAPARSLSSTNAYAATRSSTVTHGQPLLARSDASRHAELEGPEHARECAAASGEDDALSKRHDPDTCVAGRVGGCCPGPSDVGEEAAFRAPSPRSGSRPRDCRRCRLRRRTRTPSAGDRAPPRSSPAARSAERASRGSLACGRRSTVCPRFAPLRLTTASTPWSRARRARRRRGPSGSRPAPPPRAERDGARRARRRGERVRARTR